MRRFDNRLRMVSEIMVRRYRVVNFSELVDDVYGYLSEFKEIVDNDVVADYLMDNELETDIANMVRNVIQSHDYYSETDRFDDGDIEFTVQASRDEFDSIETEEDGTMTIGVRLEFGLYYDDIYDGFEDHARWDFDVEIKGVE